MRRLLLLAAFLVFLAGLQLFVFPERTADWFAWTIAPPMTAVFLGAAYWSSAVLEVAGARAADWHRARVAVGSVLVFTTLTLVVTLVHLDRFHLGAEHPAGARAITWGWLAIYLLVPVALSVVGVVELRRARTGAGAAPGRRLPVPLRSLLLVLGVVLVGTGVVLLVAPDTASTLWSWPLTPLTARAVGAWLVGLGWAAGHAGLIDDVLAVRPVGFTGVTFVVLQAVALARYGEDLSSGPAAAAYGVGLAAIGVAAVWILALGTARRGP
ncbi:hypothetical protein [Nocardioides pantholopis]|uniref:hypothetical protein n=1 Tax=Nocardioides pantholopis TaxID=2483798 RepID=UPI000F078C4A|nr:hypothetical protein [Nocardioides pantholopis]